MSELTTTTELYARIALLRRKVLLHYLVRRALFGLLGILALIVSLALMSFGLFLWLRPRIGEVEAIFAIAALQVIVGGVCLALAVRQPASTELDALAEAEATAFAAVGKIVSGIVDRLRAIAELLQHLRRDVGIARAGMGKVQSSLRNNSRPATETEHLVPGRPGPTGSGSPAE